MKSRLTGHRSQAFTGEYTVSQEQQCKSGLSDGVLNAQAFFGGGGGGR